MSRKLATVRRIDQIRPIEGADAIECAVIGGWTVVVKRGEFTAGDLAVYLEIDSWVPTELAPFLSKGQEPREYMGVKGERLRTVKLRGQLSQGLLLPAMGTFPEGTDMTEALGIQKYEPPVPAQLAGQVKGMFPSFIPKTDQERIQNLQAELQVWHEKNFTWEVTEKLDGSSMTVYVNEGNEGVCSRNLDLKFDDNVTFWKVTVQDDIINKIRSTNRNLAIQGELIGEGIQGNKYNIKGHRFFVFDVYDIDKKAYLMPNERFSLITSLGLNHAPILHTDSLLHDMNMSDILFSAEGKSSLNNGVEREGIVFKAMNFESSFKAISNKWLMKFE